MSILSVFSRKQFAAFLLMLLLVSVSVKAVAQQPTIQFNVSVPDPSSHAYHVTMSLSKWNTDTLLLKMPNWTPGYYQLMNYAGDVQAKAKPSWHPRFPLGPPSADLFKGYAVRMITAMPNWRNK